MAKSDIESVLREERLFPPPPKFSASAHIGSLEEYRRICKRAEADPEAFWAEHADALHWFSRWSKVLEWNPPFAKWFVGGRINASYNCLDRHVNGRRREKAAIVWEGEPGDSRVFTYQELLREVCRLANGLKRLGVSQATGWRSTCP